MRRKFIAILLTVFTVLLMVPFTASAAAVEPDAAEGKCGDNITWKYDALTGTLTLSGSGEMYDYERGKDAPWSSYTDSITHYIIADGITSLGQNSVAFCKNLKSINIPDSVTKIGSSAFQACQSLSKIVIPTGVTSIGSHAFAASGIDSIVIPDNVTQLGNNVFGSCSKLKGAVIGNGVKVLPEGAFTASASLNSVSLGKNVETIEKNAFFGCFLLSSITMGNKVTSIGEDAFGSEYTSSLKTVNFKGTEEEWNSVSVATGNEVLSKVTVNYLPADEDTPDVPVTPDPVDEEIYNGTCGDYAVWSFDPETGVLTISGTGDMKTDASGAPWQKFSESIKTVKVEEGVTSVSDSAFAGCASLENVSLPDSLTSIGKDAFKNCTSLKKIAIPANVTEIDTSFDNCTALEEITVSDNLKRIKKNALHDTAWYTSNFKNEEILYLGGVVYDYYGTDENVVIRDGTKSITSLRSSKMKSVILPKSLETVEGDAFTFVLHLEDIYYKGSKEEFGKITFYSGITDLSNDTLDGVRVHYNYVSDDETTANTPETTTNTPETTANTPETTANTAQTTGTTSTAKTSSTAATGKTTASGTTKTTNSSTSSTTSNAAKNTTASTASTQTAAKSSNTVVPAAQTLDTGIVVSSAALILAAAGFILLSKKKNDDYED